MMINTERRNQEFEPRLVIRLLIRRFVSQNWLQNYYLLSQGNKREDIHALNGLLLGRLSKLDLHRFSRELEWLYLVRALIQSKESLVRSMPGQDI